MSSDVVVYISGDKIAKFQKLTHGGNGDDMKVVMEGVEPLGTSKDVFKIVVRQTNGASEFSNGQFVFVYDKDGNEIYSGANPQNDEYQGRGGSLTHQIFTTKNFVIDINGIKPGTLTYGPGVEPKRNTKLPFKSFAASPREATACFTPGTMIRTPDGLKAVETLRAGDMVLTRDNGPQKILWAGRSRTVGVGPFAPVLIEAGALGNTCDMRVSQQHRMMIAGIAVEAHFATEEVLVAAVHLVNGTTIRIEPTFDVTYVHIACAGHEIIEADGAVTETMFFGETILNGMSDEMRDELEALFPNLREMHVEKARRCLSKRESRLLV